MFSRDWSVPRWVKKMGMERQVEVVKLNLLNLCHVN